MRSDAEEQRRSERSRAKNRRAAQSARAAGAAGTAACASHRSMRRRRAIGGRTRHVCFFFDIRRVWKIIAARRGRGLYGCRLADAAQTARRIAVHREIDMDVIVVERVRSRREHGREMLAGAGLHVAQERLRLLVAARPVAHDRDRAAVRQNEAADVERIAEGMFGQRRAHLVVHAAAGIGAHRVDLRDIGPEARRAPPAARHRQARRRVRRSSSSRASPWN